MHWLKAIMREDTKNRRIKILIPLALLLLVVGWSRNPFMMCSAIPVIFLAVVPPLSGRFDSRKKKQRRHLSALLTNYPRSSKHVLNWLDKLKPGELILLLNGSPVLEQQLWAFFKKKQRKLTSSSNFCLEMISSIESYMMVTTVRKGVSDSCFRSAKVWLAFFESKLLYDETLLGRIRTAERDLICVGLLHRHACSLLELQKLKGPQLDDCSICVEEFEESKKSVLLSCGHYFHADCVEQWALERLTCPLCRRTLGSCFN